MKIKMIDLLVKIANREKVPKKIKYKNKIYERYQNISTNNLYYYQVPNKCEFLIDKLSSAIDLLDEVEIIEESKKIEKINRNRYPGTDIDPLDDILDKLDELIDEINNLKEND